MSSVYKLLPYYTYENYCQWEGRWEIIEGIPYAMSPLPSVKHQDVSGNIYALFRQALQQSKCPCKAYLPLDYKISNDTIVQPDVLITCPPVTHKNYITEPPALVVEILSPSTALKDRNTKYQLYKKEKIPYYLIIDVDKEQVEILQITTAGEYEPIQLDSSEPFRLKLTEDCSIQVDLQQIWK